MAFFGPLLTDLQLLVLQSWIGRYDDGGLQLLKALSAFDIACSNHSHRSAFLQLLSHPGMQWPETNFHNENVDLNDLYMERVCAFVDCSGAQSWLRSRKVALSTFTAKDIPSLDSKKSSAIPTVTSVFSHRSVPAGLLAAFPNVRSIECYGGSAIWKKLASTKHHVKRLVCGQEYNPKAQSSVDAICAVLRADYLEELKVNITPPPYFHDQINRTLCDCTNLRVLQVSALLPANLLQLFKSCVHLSDLMLISFHGSHEQLADVLANGKQLKRFQLSQCQFDGFYTALHMLAMALEDCPWLEYTRFRLCSYDKQSGCLHLSDTAITIQVDSTNALQRIVTNCEGFSKLIYGNNINVSILSIKLPVLLDAFKDRLKELIISSSSTLEALQLALLSPLLDRLEVSHFRLSDDALKALARTCKALRFLSIEGIDGAPSNLSDDGFEAIFAGCHQLKELKVAYIASLTSKSLTAILVHRLPLRQLSWQSVGFGKEDVDRFRQDAANMQLLPVPLCVEYHPR